MQIHDYARRGDIAGVARELASGVDVDCRESNTGRTVLEIVTRSIALQIEPILPYPNMDMIHFLVEQGAVITPLAFQDVVEFGDLEMIKLFLTFGAKADTLDENGCGKLTSAAWGHSAPDDTSLIPILELLIEQGADMNNVCQGKYSALLIASERGRFDAVRYLLDRGADAETLGWTDLMCAIVFGTLDEVEALLAPGPSLGKRDMWERTPWLLSLQVGDLNKAQRLLAAGSERNVLGYEGRTPCMYAADHPHVLEWLIAEGFDVNASDDAGDTPLSIAGLCGYSDRVKALIHMGANPGKCIKPEGYLLDSELDFEVIRLLLAAGANLRDICEEGNRVRQQLIGGIFGELHTTLEEYQADKYRRSGRSNPERMDISFWQAMIRSGCNAYHAQFTFGDTESINPPVWCYKRFGRTTTPLPDGRIVEIGGEHEDFYDSDFCIYNDVVVFDGTGNFEIWGYPMEVFPPTDYHSATPVGDYLYLIGCLGYPKQRVPDETPVYRLDCRTFRMKRIRTRGENPGWIWGHQAWYEARENRICVSGGDTFDGQDYVPNSQHYALDLKTFRWVRLP